MEATVKIAEVEQKTGQSQKGPWTLTIVTDGNDTSYKTFDTSIGDAILGLKGEQAKLTFTEKTNPKGFTDRTLQSVEPAQTSPTANPDGTANWDVIGQQKSLCHLWGAYFAGNPIPEGMTATNTYLAQAQYAIAFAQDSINSVGQETRVPSTNGTKSEEDIPF